MQKLSKPFFLGSIAGGIGLGVVLTIIMTVMVMKGSQSATNLLPLAMVPMLYGAVVMVVLFYKMWASIQDGHARTTPGKAIGFMFIPFFNIYWAFQVIWGFAKDFNSFVDRHSIQAVKLPEGLFLAYTILCFTGWIPVIGVLGVIVNYFIGLAMVSKICDAVNAIPQAVPQAATA